jgi:two-component system chemotaxis response regulator CheY
MDWHGKRVLVAEDDNHARDLLALLLEQTGYAVHTARYGAEALEELQRRQFHVVVADYHMPRFDGLQLLALSRSVCPNTPVVLISADPSGLAELATRQGAYAWLRKPYEVEVLLKIVNAAVRQPFKERI